MLAVYRHRQPGQTRPWSVGPGIAQAGRDDGIHQAVSDKTIGKGLSQQIPGLAVARRGFNQPRWRQRQPFRGDLAAHVIEHHRIQGLEARLLPPIFASLVRHEYRQAEVIIGVCRQIVGHDHCRPATACRTRHFLGTVLGSPREADHHRPCPAQVSEPKTVCRNSWLPTKSVSSVFSVSAGSDRKTVSGSIHHRTIPSHPCEPLPASPPGHGFRRLSSRQCARR